MKKLTFTSNETPYNDTWDGEDRASAIKYGTVKQVNKILPKCCHNFK